MILFNYLINLVEGLILSSFVAFYFDLKSKRKYILSVSAICFLIISISNYFDSFDQTLLYILVIVLLLSLWFAKKQINFEDIIICSTAGILLLIGNLVSLSCTSLIFGVDTGEIYKIVELLVFAIILSKIIFSLMAIVACVFKVKVSSKLPVQNWWIILLLGLSIIFVLAILTEILLADIVITTNMTIILMISVIVISTLFILVFRKIQLENSEKMKYALEIQKNEFNTENFNKIKVMTDQIVDAEHRMMYILIQIQNCINNGDYDNAALITDEYIKKVKSFDTIITTNNPYLDFVLSRKINDYMFENIYVKNSIFIYENELYNNKKFCDLILLTMDLFKDNLNDKKELSLSIHQENDFTVIVITGKMINTYLEISDNIYQLINYFKSDYNLENIGNIIMFKMIIEL